MGESERALISIGALFNAFIGDAISGLDAVAPLIDRYGWRDLLCAAVDNSIIDLEAERLRFSPKDDQLQACADAFRLRLGLETVERFYDWMNLPPPVSLDDFELTIVRQMRKAIVRKAIVEGKVEPRFDAHSWRYLSALLSHIVVNDEGIARELYYVITEESEDFHTLCRQYSEASGIGKRLGGYGSPQWGAELGEECARSVLASPLGAVLEPAHKGDKWIVSRVEALVPPVLDQPTRAYIEAEIFSEWLADRQREIIGPAIVPDSIQP